MYFGKIKINDLRMLDLYYFIWFYKVHHLDLTKNDKIY